MIGLWTTVRSFYPLVADANGKPTYQLLTGAGIAANTIGGSATMGSTIHIEENSIDTPDIAPGAVTATELAEDYFQESEFVDAPTGGADRGKPILLNGSSVIDAAFIPSGVGVTDHGALTGNSDDDHTQYHNDTRGDARYYQQSEFKTARTTNEEIGVRTEAGTGKISTTFLPDIESIAADVVGEDEINFGTDAGEVDASLVPINDDDGYTTETTVEGGYSRALRRAGQVCYACLQA